MSSRRHDIAIAGGGLAGGLIALALTRARPDLSVVLVEEGEVLGGNHRWSWFESDLDAQGNALLATMRKTSWDGGYDVAFPGLVRHLSTPYVSLASADFDAALRRELPAEVIRCRAAIAGLDAQGIHLASGEDIPARAVIDCRGFEPTTHLNGGWQVFMGRHMRTPRPHGITRPLIMDARVEQVGGYRFVYVLPLGVDEVFIEDTYYADSPVLDRRVLGARIEAYCGSHRLEGQVLGNETGVLPVITGGNFAAWQAEGRIPGVARAGTRALLCHPLTSYSLPQAIETALAVAADADLPGEQMAAMLESRAAAHWRRTGFYRMLGRMLFDAGEADSRYRVFRRFYGLSQPLVERFYAARSSLFDKARVLCGVPPVPVGEAIGAILGQGRQLEMSA